MESYKFEVRNGDKIELSVSNVKLQAFSDAFTMVDALARNYDAPGTQISVTDKHGDIVVHKRVEDLRRTDDILNWG